MGKLKLYSVDRFEYYDLCKGYGYFQHLENAMNMALKVVANCQDEIVMMREHYQKENLPFDDYSEDMHRVEETNHVAQWMGGYNEVVIYEIETED